jgi:two-component system sensor kinase FixL
LGIHRTFIIIVLGAVILQAVLIAGFIAERIRRRRAERSLRKSEERISLVVEASPNGIVLMNRDGQILMVNAQTEKLFSYSREELVGQDFEILVPEQTRAAYLNYRKKFVIKPNAHLMGAGGDLFARRKDGSKFPAEIGISPILTREGTLVLIAIVDISARKRAETEARRYREVLAHIGRVEMVTEMATSLAHELNQPLTGIMNNASAGRRFIAKGRADMPKLDRLFDSVIADTRRAGEIIRGIRNMVQKGEAARTSVNLNDIVADVMRFAGSDALERHCTALSELDPNLPVVSANAVQLQQVLLNIIINAFDAMKEIPIVERRVIVRTERDSDKSVRVSVHDFGIGLPVENPERIFEHFFSTKRDGLGMGLSIARSIISSHGGELSAENAKGKGACVHFSLPAT